MAVVGNNTAGRALPNIAFFGSASWTPAFTMQAYVYVIGAGGSGAFVNTASTNRGSGGGAGGDGGGGSGGMFGGHGGAGGNGGAGGVQTVVTAATGAAGGTATGGTICNNTGGAGGTVSDGNKRITGGGGVGLWSTGNAGGAAVDGGYTASPGGHINYPTGTLVSGTDYTLNSTGGIAAKASMAPFPLQSNYSQYQNFHNASNTSYRPTQIMAGNFTSQYQFIAGSAYYQGPASPFCGGYAFYLSGTGAAGGGGMGAGGGAATLGTGFSGQGGDGGVLIFPVDLG